MPCCGYKMTKTSRTLAGHLWRLGLSCGAILTLISVWLVQVGALHSGSPGQVDLCLVTAASHAFWRGHNPYDSLALWGESQSLKVLYPGGPTAIWHPPWALAALGPLAELSCPLQGAIWLVFNITLLMCLALALAWVKENGFNFKAVHLLPKLDPTTVALALTFRPLYHCLERGQFSFAVSVFLWAACLTAGAAKPLIGILSGLLVSIFLIKPHLLFLVVLLWFWIQIASKNWRSLSIPPVIFLALCLAANFVLPEVWQMAVETPRTEDLSQFFEPTIGAWLQSLAPQHFWLRFIPGLAALFLFPLIVKLRTGKGANSTIFRWCFLLSVLCGAHAWAYDFAALLPGALFLAHDINASVASKRQRGALLGALFLLHLSTFFGPKMMNLQIYIPVGYLVIEAALLSVKRAQCFR